MAQKAKQIEPLKRQTVYLQEKIKKISAFGATEAVSDSLLVASDVLEACSMVIKAMQQDFKGISLDAYACHLDTLADNGVKVRGACRWVATTHHVPMLSSMPHATLQHAAFAAHHPGSMQHAATCSLQLAACSLQLAACSAHALQPAELAARATHAPCQDRKGLAKRRSQAYAALRSELRDDAHWMLHCVSRSSMVWFLVLRGWFDTVLGPLNRSLSPTSSGSSA